MEVVQMFLAQDGKTMVVIVKFKTPQIDMAKGEALEVSKAVFKVSDPAR